VIEQVEPWGDRRLDLLFARMTAFLANLVRDEKKHSEPFTATDFMPDWEEVWNRAVVRPPADTLLTDEEELARSNVLASKVLLAQALFTGVPSQ
jgi:hypothetical protein